MATEILKGAPSQNTNENLDQTRPNQRVSSESLDQTRPNARTTADRKATGNQQSDMDKPNESKEKKRPGVWVKRIVRVGGSALLGTLLGLGAFEVGEGLVAILVNQAGQPVDATGTPTPDATKTLDAYINQMIAEGKVTEVALENSPTFIPPTPTADSTATYADTNTATAVNTPANTATAAYTNTESAAATFTSTPKAEPTQTPTAPNTATLENTATSTVFVTPTLENTATVATVTKTPTLEPTLRPTKTDTLTKTPTNTKTATATSTASNTATFTLTPSETHTLIPTNTPHPSKTPSETQAPTMTLTETPTLTLTPADTATIAITETGTFTKTTAALVENGVDIPAGSYVINETDFYAALNNKKLDKLLNTLGEKPSLDGKGLRSGGINKNVYVGTHSTWSTDLNGVPATFFGIVDDEQNHPQKADLMAEFKSTYVGKGGEFWVIDSQDNVAKEFLVLNCANVMPESGVNKIVPFFLVTPVDHNPIDNNDRVQIGGKTDPTWMIKDQFLGGLSDGNTLGVIVSTEAGATWLKGYLNTPKESTATASMPASQQLDNRIQLAYTEYMAYLGTQLVTNASSGKLAILPPGTGVFSDRIQMPSY